MFNFSLQRLSAIFLILRRTERDMFENVYFSPLSTYFRKKYWNIKFHENPPSGRRFLPCGLADLFQIFRGSSYYLWTNISVLYWISIFFLFTPPISWNREFRNVGTYNSYAGESPKRNNTTGVLYLLSYDHFFSLESFPIHPSILPSALLVTACHT